MITSTMREREAPTRLPHPTCPLPLQAILLQVLLDDVLGCHSCRSPHHSLGRGGQQCLHTGASGVGSSRRRRCASCARPLLTFARPCHRLLVVCLPKRLAQLPASGESWQKWGNRCRSQQTARRDARPAPCPCQSLPLWQAPHCCNKQSNTHLPLVAMRARRCCCTFQSCVAKSCCAAKPPPAVVAPVSHAACSHSTAARRLYVR